MQKRLLVGLIKGLVIGLALGAAFTYGLHWEVPSGELLGFLLAGGAAGSTGVFAGKPPWAEGAWIEALLKGVVGVGVGALLYWLYATYLVASIVLPGVEHAAPWTSLPVLFLPAITTIYGSLIELDNSDSRGSGTPKRRKNALRTRVSSTEAIEDAEFEEQGASGKRRRA